jgi:hypothetical protein
MNVLKWFFRQSCSHRFAWPRVHSNVSHYQICLACGTAYEYDWTKMRRTSRLIGAGPSTARALGRVLGVNADIFRGEVRGVEKHSTSPAPEFDTNVAARLA